MAHRLTRLRSLVILLALLLAIFFTRPLWLPSLATPLIFSQSPAKADIVVVLAGDQYGRRILKGGELVRDGFVPLALVSSPPGNYGNSEADLAIPFAVRHGFPAAWFAASPNQSHNTIEEAASILDDLERRHIRNFLLVTSDYHSARAARIYRSALSQRGNRMTFRLVASPDEYFRPTRWWESRESRKTFFLEWNKTITSAFGI